MDISDPKIISLKARVEAAQLEFDQAVTFHEMWKPATYDDALRDRMGVSYATHGYLIVRAALRREMLLALWRLWDRDDRTIAMHRIADALREQDLIAALAEDRAARIGVPGARLEMLSDLSRRAAETIAIIDKYADGTADHAVLKNLRNLRNERLAHHQVQPSAAPRADPTDEQIEAFYQDNSEIVRLLLSLVLAMAYDPKDAGSVFQHYATMFWAGVSGEQTEGHPNYRRRPAQNV